MRISDWSSDVCSSDLAKRPDLGPYDRRVGPHGHGGEIVILCLRQALIVGYDDIRRRHKSGEGLTAFLCGEVQAHAAFADIEPEPEIADPATVRQGGAGFGHA